MPNRFEQSAPPSVDKIYQGLPIGPFGVSPFIYRNRKADQTRSFRAPGLLIRRSARWLLQMLRARFGKVSPEPAEMTCCSAN